jgi:hypothetical protein
MRLKLVVASFNSMHCFVRELFWEQKLYIALPAFRNPFLYPACHVILKMVDPGPTLGKSVSAVSVECFWSSGSMCDFQKEAPGNQLAFLVNLRACDDSNHSPPVVWTAWTCRESSSFLELFHKTSRPGLLFECVKRLQICLLRQTSRCALCRKRSWLRLRLRLRQVYYDVGLVDRLRRVMVLIQGQLVGAGFGLQCWSVDGGVEIRPFFWTKKLERLAALTC